MELFDIKPSERVIEIVSPAADKNPIGIRVTIVHIDDDRLKKLKRSIQDERIRLETKGKFLKTETIENNLNELTYAAMTGWEWYNPTGKKGDKGFDENAALTIDGKVPPFDKKNVFQIFDKLPWFLEQVSREIGDQEAFF